MVEWAVGVLERRRNYPTERVLWVEWLSGAVLKWPLNCSTLSVARIARMGKVFGMDIVE